MHIPKGPVTLGDAGFLMAKLQFCLEIADKCQKSRVQRIPFGDVPMPNSQQFDFCHIVAI